MRVNLTATVKFARPPFFSMENHKEQPRHIERGDSGSNHRN